MWDTFLNVAIPLVEQHRFLAQHCTVWHDTTESEEEDRKVEK